MANAANETIIYPFTAFNFEVEINVPGVSNKLCNASFSECDGLEINMDVKSIREGGNNTSQLRLFGAVNYGTLTLKRGMTANFDLWDWFNALYEPGKARTRGVASIVYLAPDKKENVRFVLSGCIPIKLKAGALNGKDGTVAIEEMQVAYESLEMKKPSGS